MHVGAICTLDSLSLLLGTVYILSFLVLGMGGVLLLITARHWWSLIRIFGFRTFVRLCASDWWRM